MQDMTLEANALMPAMPILGPHGTTVDQDE
jgi:hypothetical protein